MTENDSKAVGICEYLVERGHTVNFDFATDTIAISPTPGKVIVQRVVANEGILTALFRSLERAPATNHAFTVAHCSTPKQFRNAKEYGVCLACGIPWLIHARPPESLWQIVTDLQRVVLVSASPLPVEDEVAA